MLNQLDLPHCLHFWTVASEDSIQVAAAKLRLAHPTISSQIRLLEGQLGHKLLRLRWRGYGLVLAEEGELVFQYASFPVSDTEPGSNLGSVPMLLAQFPGLTRFLSVFATLAHLF